MTKEMKNAEVQANVEVEELMENLDISGLELHADEAEEVEDEEEGEKEEMSEELDEGLDIGELQELASDEEVEYEEDEELAEEELAAEDDESEESEESEEIEVEDDDEDEAVEEVVQPIEKKVKKQMVEKNSNAATKPAKKAGADEKEEKPRKRAPRIHTITDTLRAETVDIRRQKEKQELSEYMYLKTPIIGKLENCEPSKDGEVGVVMYGSTRVVIPAEHIIDLGTPELIDENGDAWYRPARNTDKLVKKDAYAHSILRKRLGMELDYIVKGMIEDETRPGRFSFVGSRTEAMKVKRKRNYYPDERGYVQLAEGDITECRVVSVGTKSITVEIEGVETIIRAEELTYKHIANFTPNYKAGDIIVCKILGVTHGSRKDREVTVEASVKQTVENPMIDLMETFKPGASYDGKVTYIWEKGIFVEITDDIDCYCHFPMYLPRPELGQLVAVDLQRVDSKNFKLQGRITKLREIRAQ